MGVVSEGNGDVLPWLKSMPVAPEYRSSAAEFQDPISYIFKIEKEASKYEICKIIPPFPPSSRKTAIANLTTRQQQIGFTEFVSKSKSFEKHTSNATPRRSRAWAWARWRLKRCSGRRLWTHLYAFGFVIPDHHQFMAVKYFCKRSVMLQHGW